jgi:hypothetical protein
MAGSKAHSDSYYPCLSSPFAGAALSKPWISPSSAMVTTDYVNNLGNGITVDVALSGNEIGNEQGCTGSRHGSG